ncbi:LOW QUALITY PROTEIN: hypothetical protein TorRG33x02_184570 [Trema orientale]|uniref:Uncharacterized protein n=1 Tax=Trema orientale TaxID=63057 RepID=A0A2P5EJJ6_TREOI|nr:LOW QUALITY PROTEIN: hypothetical protein TorRG33x02_184570 [Trema orientale]
MRVECVGFAFEVPGTSFEVLGMGVPLKYLGSISKCVKEVALELIMSRKSWR